MFDVLEVSPAFDGLIEPRKKRKKKTGDIPLDFGFYTFPLDEEGEPREPTAKDFKNYNKKKIEKAIRKKTKKKKHIIHGARAVNKQVTPKYRRATKDYDVWAGHPAQQADDLEDELDELVGCDMFYERTLTMPDSLTGRQKQVHQVVSRKTGKEVTDYTSRPPRASFVNITGFRYESLDHAQMTKEAILRDAQNPFSQLSEKRIKKTKRDLNRIKRYKKSRRKKK